MAPICKEVVMTDIPVTKRSAVELYNKGTEKEQKVHQAAEGDKLHTLRGGSVGCVMEDGSVIGASPFRALARFCGIQFPIVGRTFKIFDGGFSNEHTWEQKMTQAGVGYLCESDIPLKYKVGNYYVTGRPDMVVGTYKDMFKYMVYGPTTENFNPEFGIEFKSVASMNTAKKVFLDHTPKDDNLIQAAHYMIKFGIPWVLVYSSTSIQKAYDTATWMYDKNGKRVMSIHNDTGDKRLMFEYAGEIDPQDAEFKIGLDGDNIYYIDPHTEERVDTLITASGIDKYYELVVKMYETGDLSLGKLSTTDMFGNRIFYDTNLYDEFQLLARPSDYDYDMNRWLDRLRELTQQPYMMQIRKKKYQITLNGDVLEIFNTYEEAINFINNPTKGWTL